MNQTSKQNYAQPASPSGEVPERAERGCRGIAIASFISAVAFSIAGFIVPPLGDLTEANLYLVAQFLLVTTSIFGVSSIVNHNIKRNEKDFIHNSTLLGGAPDADE